MDGMDEYFKLKICDTEGKNKMPRKEIKHLEEFFGFFRTVCLCIHYFHVHRCISLNNSSIKIAVFVFCFFVFVVILVILVFLSDFVHFLL